MKTKRIFALVLCAVFLFAACGKKAPAASSKPQSTAPGGASSSASSASSAPSASSASSAPASGSTSSTSASASASTSAAPTVLQTMTLYVNGTNERAVLSMDIPEEWVQDGPTTLSTSAHKVLETGTLWKVTDPANPFTAEMDALFADDSSFGYPEGYGLQRTTNSTIGNGMARCYLYKTWPDDADKAWYPHHYLYVIGDYVLNVNLFSFEETASDAQFESVLASMQLFF